MKDSIQSFNKYLNEYNEFGCSIMLMNNTSDVQLLITNVSKKSQTATT